MMALGPFLGQNDVVWCPDQMPFAAQNNAIWSWAKQNVVHWNNTILVQLCQNSMLCIQNVAPFCWCHWWHLHKSKTTSFLVVFNHETCRLTHFYWTRSCDLSKSCDFSVASDFGLVDFVVKPIDEFDVISNKSPNPTQTYTYTGKVIS